jgi:hypothetical protein
MRKLLDRKIVEQNRLCALCRVGFTDYSDIVADHKNPRGMGGAWRDDHAGPPKAKAYSRTTSTGRDKNWPRLLKPNRRGCTPLPRTPTFSAASGN